MEYNSIFISENNFTFIHLFFLPPISNISASPFISSFEIASFFILSLCQAWFNHDHLDGNNSILTGYQAPVHDCAYPNTDINHIMSFLCLEPSNGFSSDSEQRPKPLAGPLATLHLCWSSNTSWCVPTSRPLSCPLLYFKHYPARIHLAHFLAAFVSLLICQLIRESSPRYSI